MYEIRHRDEKPGDGEKFDNVRDAIAFMEDEVGVRMTLWQGAKALARFSPSKGWFVNRVPFDELPRVLQQKIEESANARGGTRRGRRRAAH